MSLSDQLTEGGQSRCPWTTLRPGPQNTQNCAGFCDVEIWFEPPSGVDITETDLVPSHLCKDRGKPRTRATDRDHHPLEGPYTGGRTPVPQLCKGLYRGRATLLLQKYTETNYLSMSR